MTYASRARQPVPEPLNAARQHLEGLESLGGGS